MKACPTCDAAKCCHCGFVPFAPGADWGILDGPRCSDYCEHVHAMRYCNSCSDRWWRVGLEPDWDIDGAAWKDCPESAAEAQAKPVRLAPLAPEPPTETVSAIAFAICRGDGRREKRGVLT